MVEVDKCMVIKNTKKPILQVWQEQGQTVWLQELFANRAVELIMAKWPLRKASINFDM